MPLLGDGLLRRQAAVPYLLLDEFTTAAAAPLTSPRACEPGPGILTLFQVDGQYSIATGELVVPAQASPIWGDQGLVGAPAVTRTPGIALVVSFNLSTLGVGALSAWATAATATIYAGANSADNAMSLLYVNSIAGLFVTESSGTNVIAAPLFTLSTATQYQIALVLRAIGGYALIKGGIFTDWTLIFVGLVENTATLYPVFSNYDNVETMQRFAVKQAGGGFAADTLHVLSQANPSGSYAAVADGIFDLTVTAPTPLADSVHLKYRYQDANNYWDLYLDSAGALKLDSVSAGVATNRISVAGVASAAGTYTIRVIAEGSKHNVYSLSGTQWTKQGGEVNVAHLDAVTGVNVSATSYIASLVKVWPRTSSNYSVLDNV